MTGVPTADPVATTGSTAVPATAPPSLEAGAATRGVAVSTASQLVAKVVHLVTNVVSSVALIRYLSPVGYGDLVLVMTVTVLVGLLADLGLNKLAVREILQRDDAEGAVVGSLVAARVVLALAAIGLVQLVLAVLGTTGEVRLAGAIASAGFVAEAALGIVVVFHVRLEQHYEAAVRVVAEVVETGLVLVLIALGATLPVLVAAPVVGLAIGAGLALVLARRRSRLRLRVDGAVVRRLLRFSLTVGPALLLGVLYLRVDTFLLAALRPADEVGIYGAAFQPMEYLLLGTAVLINVLFPILARCHGTDPARFARVYHGGVEGVIGSLLPVPVLLLVLAPAMVETVYGPGFAPSARPMQILAWSMVALALSVWHGFVLLAVDRQRDAVVYNAVALTFSVCGNLALIPRYGYLGAAAATAATAALVVGLSLRAVHRAGIPLPGPGRIARIGAAALGAAVVARVLAPLWPWWVVLPVALGAYAALLVGAGTVSPSDVRGLVAAVRGRGPAVDRTTELP